MRPRRLPALMVALLAALALAGCGGGGSTSTRHDGTSTAAATTTTGTTTQALPGSGRPVVTLGDKNTPEQFVLGELYDVALSAQGFQVTLTRNIGPTSVSLRAIQQGSLDIYPEYLNTWTRDVAGTTTPFPSTAAAYEAGQLYASEHGMELLNPTPFSDTEGIAVLTSYAQAHHLRGLGDLRRVAAGMTLGAPIEFAQDPAGLPAIENAYGFQAEVTEPVDIGSQYEALQNGTIQAAFVYSTDGQLSQPTFTLLRDPRHILGWGNVVPVVSASAIAAEGPTFAATINRVDALLTTRAMRELNSQVTLGNQDPATVARQFLQAHGLLPPSGTS